MISVIGEDIRLDHGLVTLISQIIIRKIRKRSIKTTTGDIIKTKKSIPKKTKILTLKKDRALTGEDEIPHILNGN